MQTKIRVGAVSYLNTKPLIYGFENGMMEDEVELVIDFPSRIASMLLENKIDAGLVPVAILPEMKEYNIISEYCIGCDGEVASVCLFSEAPIQKIEKILLDYQSRTSVELLKILLKEYWKINPLIETTTGDYQHTITGTTAALVIGDRALQQRNISSFFFDLGLEWKNFTGLPFVFAAWVSNKKIDTNFIRKFNTANSSGFNHIDEIVAANSFAAFDLKKYYSQYINYTLDENKKKGLQTFLDKLNSTKRYADITNEIQ